MPVHEEVLVAARRIGGERKDWTFTPDEIVRALPHLNPSTIRTHVTSRCCQNAPKNHLHRWAYFTRIGRGLYRLLPGVRVDRRTAEARATYGAAPAAALRDTIHSVLSRSGGYFVAECLEVAVVSQGRTLDETLANLRDAIGLHLDGEDHQALGLSAAPRLVVTYETALRVAPA